MFSLRVVSWVGVLLALTACSRSAIAQPNLRVLSFMPPATAARGDTARLQLTVSNSGDQSTTVFWSIGLTALSSDATTVPAVIAFPGSADSSNNGNLEAGQTAIWRGFVPVGNQLGPIRIGARADVGGAIAESDETDNDALSEGFIQVVTPTADLVAQSMQAPAVASRGDAVPMTCVIRNIGTGPARFASDADFLISTNPVVVRGDRSLAAGGTYPSIGASGSTRVFSCCVTIPADLAPGRYYVAAIADVFDFIGETNETNNVSASVPIDVTASAADLSLGAITFSTASARIGDLVAITATVLNNGSAPISSTFDVVARLAPGRPAVVGDAFLASSDVGGLEAGASREVVLSGRVSRDLTAGPHQLTVFADDSFTVGETNETNNTASSAFTVRAADADLVVTAIEAPGTVVRGNVFTARVTVRNQGSGPVTDGFSTTGFLSTDATVTPQDTEMGSQFLDDLAAGASATLEISRVTPLALSPGSYTYGAIADSADQVAESSNANNTGVATGAVQVFASMTDLVIDPFNGPGRIVAGDLFTVTLSIRNTGASPAPEFGVGVFVSADATISVQDEEIGRVVLAGLGSSTSSTQTIPCIVPPAVAPGTYTLGALADTSQVVGESNETNNSRLAGPLAVIAAAGDLVVTELRFPASAQAGSSFPAGAIVRNPARGAVTGSSQVGIVLSQDAVITAGDLLLASVQLDSLAPGASFAAETIVTIPRATAPGSYTAAAVADIFETAGETNEGNNVLSRAVSVTAAPAPSGDLVVDSVTARANVSAGELLPVTAVVRNAGTSALFRGTSLGFYLSNDDALTTGDRLLGEQPLQALAAGVVSTVRTELFIPGALAPGSYRLGAIADPIDLVGETNETNNATLATSAVTVALPRVDLAVVAFEAPRSLVAGTGAEATVTVSNVSQSPIRRPFSVAVSFGSGDFAGEALVAGLEPAESFAVKVPFRAPAAGAATLRAIADAAGRVAETNETNNTASLAVTVTTPAVDLRVARVLAPRLATAGRSIGVYAEILNTGSAAAGPFQLEVGLSSSSTVLAVRSVPGLLPGERRLLGPIEASAPTTGIVFIRATADLFDEVAESNEQNNTTTAAASTAVVESGMDDHPDGPPGDSLDVTGIPTSAALERAGDVDVFRFPVSVGDLVTVETSLAGLADTNLTLLRPDGSVFARNDDAPGGRASRIGPDIADAAGNWFVAVRSSDPLDRGAYSIRALVEAGRPSLRIASVSGPATAGIGSTMRVTATVDNIGTATAAAGTRLTLRFDPTGIFFSEALLGELAPGVSQSISFSERVDARLTPGDYRIRAATSANDTVVSTPVALLVVADDHPNTSAGTRTPQDVLQQGATAFGSIEVPGDVDFYRLAVSAGQTYVAQTGAAGLDDTVLTLFDAAGQRLDENDDAPGSRASRLRFTPAASGTFFLAVRGFDRPLVGGYSLRFDTAPSQERDHGATPEEATLLPLDTPLSGAIQPAADADFFRLDVRAGQQYRLEATPFTLRSPSIALLASDGATVLAEGPALTFTAAADSTLFARVSATTETATGQYIVVLRNARRPALRVTSGRATVSVTGLVSPLERADILLVTDSRFNGVFSSGDAAAGLRVRLLDLGQGQILARLSNESGLPASRPARNGPLFTLGIETAAVIFAELTTPDGDTFRLEGCYADAGLGQQIVLRLGSQGEVLPTLADPLLPGTRRSVVRLDGRLSSDPNLVPAPLTYRWTTLASPAPVTLSDPLSPTPTFQPSLSGLYSFGLTVDNGTLRSPQARVDFPISVANATPFAEPRAIDPASGRRTSVTTPLLVVSTSAPLVGLDGRSSFDPNPQDRTLLRYSWRQIGGPAAGLDPSPSDPTPQFMPAKAGLYVFELVVRDPGGRASPPRSVQILAVPAGDTLPVLSLAASSPSTRAAGTEASPLRVTLPARVTLTAFALDPDPGQRLRFAWRQTGGPPVALDNLDDGPADIQRSRTSFAPTTAFVHEFECRLEEFDRAGNPADVAVTRRIRVIVDAPGNFVPVAVARVTGGASKTERPDAAANAGAIVVLDGAGSADPDGDAISYTWTQLEGPPVILSEPYSAVTTFVAPSVDRPASLVLQLFVDDGSARSVGAPVSLAVVPPGMRSDSIRAARGVNLVAVPVASDGFSAVDLADALNARLVAAVENGRFRAFSRALTAPSFPLQGNRGYLVVRDSTPASASVTGTQWPSSQLALQLQPGLNLVAFPRGAPAGFTLGDLATRTGSRFVVYDEEAAGRSRLRVFLPGLTPAPAAQAGRGYLLSVSSSVAVTLPEAQ